MDEPRAEGSKSEKERQTFILRYIYICIYIYMESRKMVLMKLFVGQESRL